MWTVLSLVTSGSSFGSSRTMHRLNVGIANWFQRFFQWYRYNFTLKFLFWANVYVFVLHPFKAFIFFDNCFFYASYLCSWFFFFIVWLLNSIIRFFLECCLILYICWDKLMFVDFRDLMSDSMLTNLQY